MNKYQLFLLEKNPNLLKKQILKMVKEGKLEELLNEAFSSKLLTFLEKNHIVIELDGTNYLNFLKNPEFVDYVLKYSISSLKYIPEEMITIDHLENYESYLKTGNFQIKSLLPLNNKILKNEKLMNYILNFLNTSSDFYEYLNYIEDEKYLLKAILIANTKNLYDEYDPIRASFYKNKTVFKKMFERFGLSLLINAPNYVDNLDIFLPFIADSILNENFIIFFDRKIHDFLRMLNKPIIIKAILNSSNIDRMFSIFEHLKIDVEQLNNQELEKYINIIKNFSEPIKERIIPRNSSKLLKVILETKNYELLKFFDNEAFSEDCMLKLADLLKNEDFDNIVLIIRIISLKNLDNFYLFQSLKEILRKKSEIKDWQEPCLNCYLKWCLKHNFEEEISFCVQKAQNDHFCLDYDLKSSPVIFQEALKEKCLDVIEQMTESIYTKENINKMYQNLSLTDFLNVSYVINNSDSVIQNLDLEEDDYLVIFSNLFQNNGKDEIVFCFIKKYQENNFQNQEIAKLLKYFWQKTVNNLVQKCNDQQMAMSLIKQILSGEKAVENLKYTDTFKKISCATYLNNITSTTCALNIENIPLTIFENANQKHIRMIIKLLQAKNVENDLIVNLAYNIYLSLGFARARDLLNPNLSKSYGPINQEQIVQIFKNINLNNLILKKDGNSYVPVLNEEWLKLVFGENYKIKNTPIRNFLNANQDKIQEIEALKYKITQDLTLTIEEKEKKQEQLDNKIEKYRQELEVFFNQCANIFNEWDIVIEEYLKSVNKSKLKYKLNISKANEIYKLLRNKRNLPDLGVADELLIQSDLFDYVGYDSQFTYYPEKACIRAVEISRQMNVYQKKFPNITIRKDNLILNVYNPQDRRLLSAGYRSKCCFRPNGDADDKGKNTSLLYYCATTEYGGGLEIQDESGNTIMFSPILRNGNVLMIHSIETKGLGWYKKTVHELLQEYANQTIMASIQNNDNIEFVFITDLHNLNYDYTMGKIPEKYRFKIYDPNKLYKGMYNNLDCEHYLLAKKDGKYFEDMEYENEGLSYEYPKITISLGITITDEEFHLINHLQNLQNLRIQLANQRYLALKNGDEPTAYELLEKISKLKKEYLIHYRELLKRRPSRDLYQEYKKVTNFIQIINDQLKIEIKANLVDIMVGTDWYIAFDEQGLMYANALESGQKDLSKKLKQLRNLRKNKKEEEHHIKK